MPRAPLEPFPQPVDYNHVLTFSPPSGPDLYFYRGQFCGLRVKGAPVVPGSNDKNPECVMAALLDVYPDWVIEEFLRLYCGYGYTHLQRSLSHALYYTDFDRFKAVSRMARRVDLFLDVWFIANEFPGFQFNQDASFWRPLLDPYIDQLLGEGLIDVACPCWQMDQIMGGAPGNATISIIAYIADRMPQTVPIYTHWIRDAMAWWKTGGEVWADQHQTILVHDRFTWWLAMQPYLTGGHFQGDTVMARTDPATYQGHIRDTLNPFNDGRMGRSMRNGRNVPFAMTNFECSGQEQFDGATSEDTGDMVGFIHTCTISDGGTGGVMGGYGNGGRRPDGGVL